jgi:hypothetical protein
MTTFSCYNYQLLEIKSDIHFYFFLQRKLVPGLDLGHITNKHNIDQFIHIMQVISAILTDVGQIYTLSRMH